MKRFYLIAIFLASKALIAQPAHTEAFGDTIYYHFYNGVQMIEIRPEKLQRYYYSDLNTENENRKPSIYLFRNQQGAVLKQYNTNGTEVMFSSLKTPGQCKNELRRHREKDSTLTPKMHRYAFKGCTGYYKISETETFADFVGAGYRDRYGIIDSLGNVVLPPVYSELVQTDSAYIYRQNGTCGLMDLHFKTILPPTYVKILRVHTSTPYYNIYNYGKWGMMDRKGKIVLPCSYEQVYATSYDPGYLGAQQNGKWGVLKNGKVFMPFKYDLPPMFFSRNPTRVQSNGLYGFVDSTGREYIPAVYASIENSVNGLKAQKDGQYFFLDLDGKVLCRAKNEVISQLGTNRFVAKRDQKQGIVDSTGNIVLDLKFGTIFYLEENLALVALNETTEEGYFDENTRWVLMDADGHRLSKRYREISRIDEGIQTKSRFFSVYDGNKYGIIDRNGRQVIATEYHYITNLYCGRVYLTKDGKHYLVNAADLDKKLVQYDEKPEHCYNGRIRVKQGHDWGYIDSTGRLVIEPKYDACMDFYNGVSVVVKNGKRMLIDRWGNQVGEGYFDMAHQLIGGAIVVTRDKKHYLVNGPNQKLVPMPYDELVPMYDSKILFKAKHNDLFGVVKNTGDIIVPVEYNNVSFTHGMIWVQKGDKMGYYDLKGNVIIPAVYESVTPGYESRSDFFWARSGRKYGVVNRQNKVLYPFVFEYINGFMHRDYLHLPEEYVAELVLKKRKTMELSYININGTLVGKRTVDNHDKGFERFSVKTKNNQTYYGVTNFDGDTIVPAIYPYMLNLQHDHFEVRIGRGTGLLDTTGKLVIPCIYDEVRFIGKTQLVTVRHNKHWALYHSSGKMLFDSTYNYFDEMPGGDLISFSKGGHYQPEGSRGYYEKARMGVLSPEGKLIIEPQYDYIWLMDEARGLLVCQLGSEMCIVDTNGRTVSGMVKAATATERWNIFMAG